MIYNYAKVLDRKASKDTRTLKNKFAINNTKRAASL